jgi:hypothetical protein
MRLVSKSWTLEEIQYLVKYGQKFTFNELCIDLDRTPYSIRSFAYRNNISLSHKNTKKRDVSNEIWPKEMMNNDADAPNRMKQDV